VRQIRAVIVAILKAHYLNDTSAMAALMAGLAAQ